MEISWRYLIGFERWRRLGLATLSALLPITFAFTTSPLSAQVYDPVMEHDYAYMKLIGNHSYQPVFNGLKYRKGSWEKRITSESGARFINRDMVLASFSLIISPQVTPSSNNYASDAEIAKLCASKGTAPSQNVSSQIRLFGLCVLADCAKASDADWRKMVSLFRREAPLLSKKLDRQSGNTADDAIFSARVAVKCQQPKYAKSLFDAAVSFVHRVHKLRNVCQKKRCPETERMFVYYARPTIAGIILASAESSEVPAPMLREAIVIWRGYDVPIDDLFGETTDIKVKELCDQVGVSANECRKNYPYSFFLERQYLRHASGLGPDNFKSGKMALQRFRSVFAKEINYRAVLGSSTKIDQGVR